MLDGSGTHFDSIVLDAFMTAMKDQEAPAKAAVA
jgi:hypothetical protein